MLFVRLLIYDVIHLFQEISEAMKCNSTLEELNLESNFLTRDGITDLLGMIKDNTTLKEFKLSNQV